MSSNGAHVQRASPYRIRTYIQRGTLENLHYPHLLFSPTPLQECALRPQVLDLQLLDSMARRALPEKLGVRHAQRSPFIYHM